MPGSIALPVSPGSPGPGPPVAGSDAPDKQFVGVGVGLWCPGFDLIGQKPGGLSPFTNPAQETPSNSRKMDRSSFWATEVLRDIRILRKRIYL